MDAVSPEKLPLPPQGDENQGPLINAFAWWTTVVALVFVALRIYTTLAIVKTRLWFDDWHILTALIASVIGAGLTSAEVNTGFGRHAHFLARDNISDYLALNYGAWILTFFTVMCTKVSVCFFLLKLPLHRTVRRVLWLSAIGIVISHLIFILLWALHCVPPNVAWDFNTTGTCLNRSTVLNTLLAQGILSAVCDYALALCPLAIVWSLPLSRKQSVGLCGLMGLGVVVGSCCIVRAFLNEQALPADATYTFVTYWFWRLIEMQLGIVCACIPALIPLYEHIHHKMTGEKRASFTSLMNAFPEPTPLQVSPHHPNVSAHSEQSEKAFLGQAAVFKRDQTEAQNRMMEQPLAYAPNARSQRNSDLRTFWTDESQEEIASSSAPKYRPLPPAAMTGKDVSFSTRDRTRHQAVISARAASPFIEPPDVLITTPYGETERGLSPEPGVARRPTVHSKNDHGLDIDLTPSFQRNRGTFGRILGMERASWRSSMMSMYSTRGNGPSRQGEGKGLMHDYV